MKKFIAFYFLFFLALTLFAQSNREVYCKIYQSGRPSVVGDECCIFVDFGQPRNGSNPLLLVDEKNKARVFHSMMDALNWMGSLGWELKEVIRMHNETNKYAHHYIFSKKLANGEKIDTGMLFSSSSTQSSDVDLETLSKHEENIAYIALLVRNNQLKSEYLEEVSYLFPLTTLSAYLKDKPEEELESLSKNAHHYFTKYRLAQITQ